MNYLIVCDKFKGSATAAQINRAILESLESREMNDSFQCHEIADGGDGSLAVIHQYTNAKTIQIDTIDPLNRSTTANYLLDGKTAYIELAEASGIAKLDRAERAPLKTNTLGTGVLINDALKRGVTKIVLMLGGSCTNDAGLGIAHSLGVRFFNKEGDELLPNGGNLIDIVEIDVSNQNKNFELVILSDVTNPFYGYSGAAYVYGPQKGASPEEIAFLDRGLRHIAELFKSQFKIDIQAQSGSGSAGGISGGLSVLFSARILKGFKYLAKLSKLEEKINWADVIITGEGKLDHSSFEGKVVGEIVKAANKKEIPVIVITGTNGITLKESQQYGINQVHSVLDYALNEDEAMKNTTKIVSKLAANIILDS